MQKNLVAVNYNTRAVAPTTTYLGQSGVQTNIPRYVMVNPFVTVDTGSRADQVIFEEFKGTGNMELILDRTISEKRVFPAINLAASGTRKEHLMLSDRELKTVTALRRRLLSLPPHVQVEQLLSALQRYSTNEQMVGGPQTVAS